MGETLEDCLHALEGHSGPELHLLERISMTFKAENSILPKAPNLTRLRVSGELPDLRVNFSGALTPPLCQRAYAEVRHRSQVQDSYAHDRRRHPQV